MVNSRLQRLMGSAGVVSVVLVSIVKGMPSEKIVGSRASDGTVASNFLARSRGAPKTQPQRNRSEEHTPELPSRSRRSSDLIVKGMPSEKIVGSRASDGTVASNFLARSRGAPKTQPQRNRSVEHTAELQS